MRGITGLVPWRESPRAGLATQAGGIINFTKPLKPELLENRSAPSG
jgi:hypothetical protein